MYFRTTLICFVACMASPIAAEGVPDEVIATCNAKGDASDLPDCLKNGALGYEMLNLARSEALYGPAADPVINICKDKNELYEEAYVCFDSAAEKASETRDLIGLEKIEDRCVAAISDADTYAKLESAYKAKHEQMFPDEMFYGGTMYHPFTGCPVAEENASAEGQNANKGNTADNGDSDQKLELSSAQCAALNDFEARVGAMSLDELKSGFDKVEAAKEEDLSVLQDAFGVSSQTTELLEAQSPDENQKVATVGLALVANAHPELIGTLMEVGKSQGAPADEMGGALAQTMMLGIAKKIATGYQTACN
ncbi:hypothetical protein [Thioclava sp. JM3]|uniref:hypothetical protein n=1 Tax=Thioclava sp. JM3 TaxID=1973004 RepID=UPI0011804507|nr:hypothetical protein [Thioclava sp. JM3]